MTPQEGEPGLHGFVGPNGNFENETEFTVVREQQAFNK